MRIGILGGAFNPPHIGHLLCAQEAHSQLGLDQVLLMPVGKAPHRELEHDPGAERRAEMCERAIGADERFAVTRIELERDGPSYTADTLGLLSQRRPDDELTLILGADQAASLPQWERPEQVLARARVAIAEREGLEHETVLRRLHAIANEGELTFFEMSRIDVSSSLVRQRVAAGRPIRYLVSDTVSSFISDRGLYVDGANA